MESEVIELENMLSVTDGDKSTVREKIVDFERYIKSLDGAVIGNNDLCPLKHSFADGVYIREMFHPKGLVTVGRIHKYAHASFIISGEVTVFTEGEGKKNIKAPYHMVSPAGTKRVVYAHEDTVWVTTHANVDNCNDILELERRLVAENYSEYENYLLETEAKKILIGKNIDTQAGVNNCGLIALRNLSDLKNISIRSIINIAEDNGLKLYPYMVSLNELRNISLPAIVHSIDHFDYIETKEDFRYDREYSGNILLTTENSEYEKVSSTELQKIHGSTFVSAGFLVSALGLVGTVTGGAIKGHQSKKAVQAQIAMNNAQLKEDAIKAKQAQEDAKQKAKTAETVLIGSASFLIIGIGVAIYFSSIKGQATATSIHSAIGI